MNWARKRSDQIVRRMSGSPEWGRRKQPSGVVKEIDMGSP
jgi:hypothetical protein